MRKKLLSRTYLRDVKQYSFCYINHDNDFYLTIKKIINIEKPFILKDGTCIMNNGYYMIEILPKKENYGMRVYLNEKKEPVEYYFDISLENGIDEESEIPFYDDAYLDVIVLNDKIFVDDQDELDEALLNQYISQENYDLAVKTKDKLIEELTNKTNKYFNLDLCELINSSKI